VNKKNPCLREYITSMWPSLWMSAAMAVAVLFSGIFLQNMPDLLILIIQVLCGAVLYLGLMIYSQKILVVEIKNMVLNRDVT